MYVEVVLGTGFNLCHFAIRKWIAGSEDKVKQWLLDNKHESWKEITRDDFCAVDPFIYSACIEILNRP